MAETGTVVVFLQSPNYQHGPIKLFRRLSIILLYRASRGNREKRRQSFIVFLMTVQNYKTVSCTKGPYDYYDRAM